MKEVCFQFLGIPPKGEPPRFPSQGAGTARFPISRDPPEGGTGLPPPGSLDYTRTFPISRDPPEGGTDGKQFYWNFAKNSFQFLGIPPKGEQSIYRQECLMKALFPISRDPPEGGTT